MRRTFGIFCAAMVLVAGLSLTGCATDMDINRGGWSEYTFIPAGDYVVVGTVVVRNVRRVVLLYALTRYALELGGHDIVSVRIGSSSFFGTRIRVATAVAVRYTADVITKH